MSGIGGQSGSCWRALKTSLLTQRRLPCANYYTGSCSLDYLIGSGKRCRRYSEAERLRGLEINDQLGTWSRETMQLTLISL